MKRKAGVLGDLQKKYTELSANFNKLLETIKAETVEKLRAQEELRFLQEYSHHIIESAVEGIITCDLDWYLTSFSPAAEKLLSYRSEEIHGRFLKDFFEKPQEFNKLNNLILKDGQAKNFETTLLNKESKVIPVILSFSDLKGPKEKPVGLVGVIRDLREIKELQAQLVQSSKLAAIGQLAAGVAHEINNPLTVALSHIQLLIPKVADRETKKDLNIIFKEMMRCTDITQGLLSFSRETAKKEIEFKELDINECIESVFFILKHKLAISKIKLVKHFVKRLPKIRGDANQLQQVFLNLILNAIDAMPQGGGLYINTEPIDRKFVRITITDTGIGIVPEDLPRIFEPFYTTKEPGRGVGLGLSISYGIIKDHNGEIEVQSKNGKTTFTITFLVSKKKK